MYTKMVFSRLWYADFRSPHSSDQRRFGRLPVRLLTDRQTDSDFHDRCSFPTRGNERLDIPHTQRDSCDDDCRIRPPGYDFSTIQSFQRFTLTSRLLKAFCFWTDLRLYSSSASCKRRYGYRFSLQSHHKGQFLWQCHLVTQASPFAKLQLSTVFMSRRLQANQSFTVSLSLYSIRYSLL